MSEVREPRASPCSICLEPLYPPLAHSNYNTLTLTPSITETSCNHKYHFECLIKWNKQSIKCPLCGQNTLNPALLNTNQVNAEIDAGLEAGRRGIYRRRVYYMLLIPTSAVIAINVLLINFLYYYYPIYIRKIHDNITCYISSTNLNDVSFITTLIYGIIALNMLFVCAVFFKPINSGFYFSIICAIISSLAAAPSTSLRSYSDIAHCLHDYSILTLHKLLIVNIIMAVTWLVIMLIFIKSYGS